MLFTKALLTVSVALALAACGGEEPFQGTALNAEMSPNFHLRDQNNRVVSLSDFQGKVVALTFLYTYCPDICPVVTETIRKAVQALGSEAEEVEFLAISVDPDRDSVESALSYSQDMGLEDRWRFLVGNREELEQVWEAYWLDPFPGASSGYQVAHIHDDGSTHYHDVSDESGDSSPAVATGDAEVVREGPLIIHLAPIFLIDRQGYRRALLNNPTLDPDPLVHDLKILINS